MTSDIGKLPDEPAACETAHPGLRDAARLARHREARKVYVDELLHPPDTRGTSYPAIAAVLVAILVGRFMFAPLPTTAERDCDANPGPGIDWNGCTFESLVAPGINLAGANLRSVSLRGADFNRATLVGANLQQADLSFSSLREADLSYADLTGAQLTGADLAGARLEHTIWVDGQVCAELSVGGCLVTR